jgi:hypothetical protein
VKTLPPMQNSLGKFGEIEIMNVNDRLTFMFLLQNNIFILGRMIETTAKESR